MQKKILKKVVPQFAGHGTEKLIDLLHEKQNVNEFLIAKKMGMTINQTRNMLYKLADVGLIEFIRKKDKKKGGWYTYFWTLKTKRVLQKYHEDLQKEIDNLRKELEKRKNERFYYSPSIDVEYTEEEAILNDFTCPETGEVLEIREPTQLINKLKSEISKIETNLVQVNKELVEIEKKEQKSTGRKLKAEQKKKDLERKKKREERKKEKNKLIKKTKKKIVKKKNSAKKKKSFHKKKKR